MCPTVAAFEAEEFVGYDSTTLEGEEVPLLPDEVWPEEPESDGAAS